MLIHARSQRGFTLIELMVAVLLGAFVIAVVGGVFVSTYQANTQNMKVVRMDAEMRAVMTLMAREIRRSGTRELAWQTSTLGTPNPFATNLNWTIGRFDTSVPTNSCVLFAYDKDGDDGAVEITDRAGYRLTNDAAGRPGIDSRRSANAGAACNAGTWEGITDREAWAVTSLNFTTTLEPGAPGVGIRTVIVTLDGAVNTRAADPTRDAGGAVLNAADCAGNTLDIVCRRLVEKVRMRNDAIL
jgi:prepilin-type N-terminal cleavage/methylation domain-containing protein